MTEKNKVLVRRWLEEVLTQGNLEVVDKLFAPNYILHDPNIPYEIHGREGAKQYITTYHAAYPDVCFRVEDQIAEGDMVVTRWIAWGTHRGEFLGIPPTGKQTAVTGIQFDRVADDKLDEGWVSYHPFADTATDQERVKQALSMLHFAFPDLSMTQADSVTEGDKVAFRWMMSGTHEEEFLGIAPTGKRVTVMGMDIVRTREGEILEYWGEFDVMGMLRQLEVSLH